MARRWRRRLLRGSLIAVAFFAVATAALPYWWPAVVRLVPGVSIGDAETQGWKSVELRDLTYVREGLRVTATSVRVPAFGWWPASEDAPMVYAQKVVVEPRPVDRPDAPPPSARRVVADILRAWPNVARWLPRAHIDELEVKPVDGPSRQFKQVNWDGARLSAQSLLPAPAGGVTATVERLDPQTLHVAATAEERGVKVEARARVDEQQLQVEGDITWRANTAHATALFGATGLMPSQATVAAPTLAIAAADLGVPGYGPINGAVHAEWTGERFTGNVTAQSAPIDASTDLPPITVDVQAAGNFSEVRVESATIQVPGVDATLSAPLVLTLPGGVPAAPAEFNVEIDLAKWPRALAQGRVSGHVNVAGGPGASPSAQFSLTGEGVHWRDGEIRQLAIAGEWTPTKLAVQKMDVQLVGESRIEATATIDLTQKLVEEAQVKARLASAALRPWWPAIPEVAELSVEATAQGAWMNPAHTGRVSWQGLAGVPGGLLDGELSWQGEGTAKVTVDGELVSNATVALPVAATVTREADGLIRAELTKLAWQDAEGEWWHLPHAVLLQFGAGGFATHALKISGDTISVTVDAEVRWPSSGTINVSAAHVAAARMKSLLPAATHPVVLDALDVRATWDRGPVQLEGSLRASYAAEENAYYSAQAEFRTEKADLAFGAVRIYDGSGAVLEGEGRLPLRLAGRDEGFRVQVPTDGELLLDLYSTPNPSFWDSISRLTGWEIAGPALQVKLAGTLAAPKGHVVFDAEALQLPAGLANTVKLPKLGNVSIIADADASGLAVTKAIWTIDENWVSFTGRAPWNLWRETRKSGAIPWRDAEFSFSADRMPLLIASRAVPRLFAPDGNVSFEMKHEPGRGLSGFLWLDSVALRPIQPLGAVRDIGGNMTLDGYTLRLERLDAYLGGQPIAIAGETNIENLEHPVFDVRLKSSRVPLVRQEGLVLRAELNLRVEQTSEKPAHISGTVDLARSVFVSDLIALLPTGGSVASPEQRPPFFSVPQEPFATWTLDVGLKGDKFLRIQNPFFRSEVSADFKLLGTLAEPRAIGRAWTDEGAIIFPFGNLTVQQAEVTLTPDQPFAFALHAQAATRIYGYNVRLEVSGTAQDPRLQFSSDPPLTSQQLFLMLSAGELPTEEHAFSTSERAQRLAMFVGRNLASTLGIGGGSGDEKLEVRSGEDFSREGGETIHVQYNLDGRWSIVAEKDRFDAYNGGIKFRLIDR